MDTINSIGNAKQILREVSRVIVGKDEVMIKVLLGIVAGGHILMEDIPGVGATRRRALLTHFKSVANIAAATPEALCEVEGIGKAQAKAIWDYYHPEEKESGGVKP